MSTTFDVARDEMYGTFRTAWEAGAGAHNSGTVPTVFYDGLGKEGEKPHSAPWARAQIRHFAGDQAAFGGTNLYERTGTVTIQIFQPLGNNLSQCEELVKVAKGAFEGVSTTSCVNFYRVRMIEVGTTESWYQMNVLADFEYHETGA